MELEISRGTVALERGGDFEAGMSGCTLIVCRSYELP